MRKMTLALAAMLALFVAAPARADGPGDAGPDRAAPPVHAAPVQDTATAPAQGRSGMIDLQEISLNVPAGYKFYSAEEALAFLQRNNAATPNGTVLGLLAKAGTNVRAPGAWATVISFDPIGYVQPETASGLSDANLEADTRTARQALNRPFEGFIAQPAFATEPANVEWAERAAAAGSGGRDLRYEQKFLGRYGVATLTSIGSADQFDDVKAAAVEMKTMLTFPEGRRIADFQAANDTVSKYSVPGLVTGVATPEAQAVAEPASQGTGQTSFGGMAGLFPWIGAGVVLLAVAGYALMRRRRRDDEPDQA